jgi:hypothetical protein
MSPFAHQRRMFRQPWHERLRRWLRARTFGWL